MPSVPEPGGPSMSRVVVVGASLAGLRTAEALRQAGFGGRLTVVGDETHPPYNRPPLTKAALVDGPDAAALSLPNAVDLEARWVLGVRARALDLDRREVRLDSGERLPFDGLVIATGASARRLPREVGDAGVHHIRMLGDAAALHQALAGPDRRVLVIGAGFLGCEVASTAASLGHRVTLVEAASGPMLAALGPELSAYCAGLHRRRGVDLRTTSTVRILSPAEGRPGTSVAVLEHHPDGDTSLVEADVVVAALGATPNTEWLRGSGLDTGHGVATDDALTALDTTGAPVSGVVAVGDVARVPQPLLDGAATRVEHWATAVGHSRIAATTLLGGQPPAAAVLPSFWTDQHGLQIRGIGLSGAADTTIVVDGAMEDDRFVVTRTRRGRLVGAVAVNNSPALFRFRSELEEASRTPQPTR
jgi:3-phenylpropionate/trans-cinnamate dioxygenase ferredoxin reductase subunit